MWQESMNEEGQEGEGQQGAGLLVTRVSASFSRILSIPGPFTFQRAGEDTVLSPPHHQHQPRHR